MHQRAADHPFGVDMVAAEHGALEVSAEERDRVFESKWQEGGFHFANECFNDLATNKKVPADLLAKLPPAEAYAKAVFPTLDEQAAGKAAITAGWDGVVGAAVK